MMQGSHVFKALKDKGCIIMAANTRITHVTAGILRAAKDVDAAVMIELAKSESDLEGGYTGLTPELLSKHTKAAAEEVGFDSWLLHGDHITVKKGTDEELDYIKKLIDAQIAAGFTSFAIDASFLFNLDAEDVTGQLKRNIEVTTELAKYIESKYGSNEFGLEVEVGEIGKKGEEGMVLTSPEEATTFIKELNANDVHPQVIAIANGSAHGNIYDENGNPIEQVSINIEQTKAVAEAMRKMGTEVRIAQHGITGTPRDLIYSRFPHGDIIKGNVGTFWQNVVFDAFKLYEPELYKRIWDWTMENYREKMPGKKDEEIFGKMGKKAINVFFDDIYAIGDGTKHAIDAMAYAEALRFFKAFKAEGSASLVKNFS